MRSPTVTSRILLGATLGAMAVASAGCPTRGPANPHTEPNTALDALHDLRNPVDTIRAEARVEQRGREGRIRGTVYLMMRRPDRVRFDAMTQFGPAAILTSDGRRFALSDLRESRYLTGPTCSENMGRLLGIRMSGEQVARFLVGDTPRIPAESESIEVTGDGTYLVTLEGAGGERQEIEMAVRGADRDAPPSAQRLRLVRSQLYGPDGKTEWKVTFDEHRVVEDPDSTEQPKLGVALPTEIEFADRRHGSEARVRIEDLELNVDLPQTAFSQSPRPGMAVEQAPCQ